MRFHFLVPVCGIVFTVLSTAPSALAQTYRAQGKGQFLVGTDAPLSLVRAGVTFVSDGTFVLEVESADKTRLRLKGTYRRSGTRRSLTIREGLGRDQAEGEGTVLLSDSGQMRSLSFTGSVDGRSYTASFNATGATSSNAGSSNFSFTGRASGSGRADIADRKLRVTRVNATLSSGNGFSLRLEGPSMDNAYKGTWSGSGPAYRVRITASGQADANITGTVTLSADRKRLLRVELDGTLDGQDYRLYFATN